VKYNRAPAVVSSLLDVPAAGPRFFDTKSVPHGKVDVRFYDSKATQSVRRVRIYTPPNYEKISGRLPVLYLLHGGEGDDTVWTDRNSVLVDYDIFMNVRRLDAQDISSLQKLYKVEDFDFRLKPGSVAVDKGTVCPT
jgi:hypothetical protein